MKKIQIQLILLFCIALVLPFRSSAQDNLPFELKYEVNRVYPAISISKEELKTANTLVDLNRHYKPSWVKEYESVEIVVSVDGKKRTATSKDHILTQEQKVLMDKVDVGTAITVNIQYLPANNLKNNEVRGMDFKFTVDPEIEAKFVDGSERLQQYLKEQVIDKISASHFKRHQLTAVKFTIDEKGEVINAHVFEAPKNEAIDQILLDAICNMPNWEPATYSNGVKVKQEFAFSVGDMESCVVNLLNIRKNLQ